MKGEGKSFEKLLELVESVYIFNFGFLALCFQVLGLWWLVWSNASAHY